MYGYKRSRVDLDADTHETLRYFALLRGINVGAICRKAMAEFAARVEGEFPPVRAHMLAWRAAQAMQSAVPLSPYEGMREIEHVVENMDELPF